MPDAPCARGQPRRAEASRSRREPFDTVNTAGSTSRTGSVFSALTIRDELGHDGLISRYSNAATDDGLPGSDGFPGNAIQLAFALFDNYQNRIGHKFSF